MFTRNETQITYPHIDASAKKQEAERMAERFEGLARSLFIAAPLIRDNPMLKINGINILEYYKKHIISCCDKHNALYVGDFDFLKASYSEQVLFPTFQQTVECAAMVIGLWISKTEIWDLYTKKEKDIIAKFIESFGYGNTVHNNWHMFNMLCLAFLHFCGYTIDKSVMLEHAHTILDFYVGDGWYRDCNGFDYYSCWAFNFYAPLWNLWYGYENAPELAIQFENNSNELMKTYYDFFDNDGFTIMWGRSSIYRNAATSAFVGNAFFKNSSVNYGLARRIMSGSLKQFLCRDDFLCSSVPSLGFYGPFSPMLQSYSCAASPLWCAKPFLALYLPKEHPLWSSKESNGSWEGLKSCQIKETVLSAPAICFTNHGSNGETVLRTAKVSKSKDNISEMWNYSKLSYNSKYPWEAAPVQKDDIESQQYVIREIDEDNILRGNVTYWAGEKTGVLYRKQFFGYHLDKEMVRTQAMYLADFPVENGIMRIDKLELYRWPVSITLGSYGFPDNGTEIIYKTCKDAKAIILKGKDYTKNAKQLAMTVYDGWDELEIVKSTGTNPDSEKSVIVYAKTDRLKAYDGKAKKVLISQVITKECRDDFKDEEIFPIKSIEYTDEYLTGGYGDITVTLKNGDIRVINFEGVNGRIAL